MFRRAKMGVSRLLTDSRLITRVCSDVSGLWRLLLCLQHGEAREADAQRGVVMECGREDKCEFDEGTGC